MATNVNVLENQVRRSSRITASPPVGKRVNVGVIGAGYLGKFHAQKYALVDRCNLIAVIDSDAATARQVAAQYPDTLAGAHYHEFIDRLDAVSIATSTPAHFAIARAFLERGKHVLLEKPMTTTIQEARELIRLADVNDCLLQIGHIERFNPVILAIDEHRQQPKFIESHRLASFKARGADVNVILDLMIHDIDIILSLARADIDSIQASGMRVLSDDIDIANARITFSNRCVANVTASRVSSKAERRLRLFQDNAYFSADLSAHSLDIYKRENRQINTHSARFAKADALLLEISHFIECVETGKTPLVSGIDGLRALHTAQRITQAIQMHDGQ